LSIGLPEVESVVTANRGAEIIACGKALPISDASRSADKPVGRNRVRIIPSVKLTVIAKRQPMVSAAAGVHPARDARRTRYFADLFVDRGSPLEQFSVSGQHQIITAAGRNLEPGGYPFWFRNEDGSVGSTRIPLVEISAIGNCDGPEVIVTRGDVNPTIDCGRLREQKWG